MGAAAIRRDAIEGGLCDLNKYITAERSNRFRAAKIKREETERVSWEAIGGGFPARHGVSGLAHLHLVFEGREDGYRERDFRGEASSTMVSWMLGC
jgi:hypothetical protein